MLSWVFNTHVHLLGSGLLRIFKQMRKAFYENNSAKDAVSGNFESVPVRVSLDKSVALKIDNSLLAITQR